MDALDANIIRVLGLEPFDAWPRTTDAPSATAVARALGQNTRLVADRIARMEQDGVITGYNLFPNPRHLGLSMTTFHVEGPAVAPAEKLQTFGSVDGFLGVVPYLGPGLCVTVMHASAAERTRRLDVIRRLADSQDDATVLYEHKFPQVARPLSALDWRIIQAQLHDGRAPPSDVAKQLGVTAKTVRTRLGRMRREGAVDQVVRLDFAKVSGIIPFELAVWVHGEIGPVRRELVEYSKGRYLSHFRPPPDGYCHLILRLFATTPAEVQSIVGDVSRVDGVERAEALMAAGSWFNAEWLQELVAAKAGMPEQAVP